MTLLTWRDEVPAEIQAAVNPHLLQWWSLIPTWCHELIIGYESDEGSGSDLKIQWHYDYRWAMLIVYGSFLKARDRSREIRHEMMHLNLAPLMDTVHEMEAIIKDKNAESENLIRERIRVGMEQTCCDLEHAIGDLRGRP